MGCDLEFYIKYLWNPLQSFSARITYSIEICMFIYTDELRGVEMITVWIYEKYCAFFVYILKDD
jgi:hypothetical protein